MSATEVVRYRYLVPFSGLVMLLAAPAVWARQGTPPAVGRASDAEQAAEGAATGAPEGAASGAAQGSPTDDGSTETPPVPPAQEPFDRFADRGDGIPTSMFGIYIRPGELLIYPFFEYYRDKDFEYQPSELGVPGEADYRGRYQAREYLLFVGYGISERLAVEIEAAGISASLDKSPADPSGLPARIEDSGLGDVEAQLRWRWNRETETGGEWFSYLETVFPLQDPNQLIGTSDWEFKVGTGWVRGLPWGTVTLRGAFAFDTGEKKPEIGEYAVEYLKRAARWLRLFAAVEGSEDELELITEAQLLVGRHVIVKLNNAVGLTSKATDWAPEVGVMFSIPMGRRTR